MKKNIGKVFVLSFVFFSTLACAQTMSATDRQKIEIVKNNASTYSNKSLKDLFNQLPPIKMIRILPNIPESGIHTVIVGFVSDKDFTNAINTKTRIERVTAFVEGYNTYLKKGDQKTKEDITTELAIQKYGDLKIFSISN